MKRTIKVTGTGKMSLKADTVRLSLELIDKDMEYEAVIRQTAAHSQEVREAFEKLGFEGTELKTVSFRVDTEYEGYQDPEGNAWKQRFTGYRAVHAMKVEFSRERDILGDVLTAVSRLSGKPEFHIEYTVKDTEAAKQELLKKAVQDSRRKAEIIAEAAYVALGEILNIDYSFGETSFVVRPVNRIAEAKMASGVSMEDSLDLDIEPEDIKVEDTVTVIWKIN